MIEVVHLTKTYANRTAVNNLCFKIEKGQIVGFLGPNGAGKTTTMRMITGFLSPTEGTCRVAGYDVLSEPMEVRKRVGYMPENVAVYREMSVNAYLTFVGKAKGLSRSEVRGAVEQVIAQCSLDQVASRPTGKLSRGYRQRVGLAQALVASPEVLVLDEPTVGLDPRQIVGIRELIKSLAGKHTIILSTHILPEVSMTCQKVIVINEGRLVEEDTPRNLAERLEKICLVTAEIVGSQEAILEVIRSTSGVVDVRLEKSEHSKHTISIRMNPDDECRTQLCRTIVEKGFGLVEMRRTKITLEEIFIQLVDEDKGSDL
ncbi:MAG TPA: ABC transporter ATP-binding protein [bacterium]|nr:ABC transporter ATP-binding protein [bacterium]